MSTLQSIVANLRKAAAHAKQINFTDLESYFNQWLVYLEAPRGRLVPPFFMNIAVGYAPDKPTSILGPPDARAAAGLHAIAFHVRLALCDQTYLKFSMEAYGNDCLMDPSNLDRVLVIRATETAAVAARVTTVELGIFKLRPPVINY